MELPTPALTGERIFVLRARKGTHRADKVMAGVGSDEHTEVIAHTLANAFYISNRMRANVTVYLVLDSTPDFPRTLKFSSTSPLSFPGFHEEAILSVVATSLAHGHQVRKGGHLLIGPGIEIFGFGFDTLIKNLHTTHALYLLDKKGDDCRSINIKDNSVFILSDHLPMPKNSLKGAERLGATKMSLGPNVLFASHCVVLIHNELDRQLLC